jgi:hypothetical protein
MPVGPLGVLLPAIPYSMVQPGFVLNLNTFALPNRQPRLKKLMRIFNRQDEESFLKKITLFPLREPKLRFRRCAYFFFVM